jgi:hypothetical protein
MRHVNNLSIKQLPDDKRGYLISSDDLDRQLEVYDRRLNSRIQIALKAYVDSLMRMYNDIDGLAEEHLNAAKDSVINRRVDITLSVDQVSDRVVGVTLIDGIHLYIDSELRTRLELTPVSLQSDDRSIGDAVIQHVRFLNAAIALYLT